MKYMGSKARLSKDILPIINDYIKKYKINTYVEPFLGGCNMMEHIICNNKIGYDKIKDNKDKYPKELVSVAGLCATYNAKWFGGYAGIVHTKANTVRNYYDEAIRNILKQVDKLKEVEFKYDSYENLNYKHCLIYCDPPYQGTTTYGTSKDFNYDTYWDKVREWSKNNIVICSEYNAPKDFICVYEKQLTTTMDKSSRKKDTEKLFIHKDLYNKLNK